MTHDASRWAYTGQALGQWFNELSAGGIFMTDDSLRIQAWNRWLENHTGQLAGDMLGVALFDAYPELVERGLDQYYRDALAGEARVVAQRFHGYLLPVSARTSPADRSPAGFMPQSARIAPLRASGAVVGTITVIENVTERVMSERELRSQIAELERARATAEAAVRMKDEFLATLSHELRTPLNAVLGWTRLLRTGQVDATRIPRALEVIDRNATAQAQLIDDMLDVARIMQGKLRLDMQPTDLVSVILAAADVIRPSADAKHVTFSTIMEVESAVVIGDANRLQQVVWNLLSNAVKFTEPGGRVAVHLDADRTQATVRVSDSGKGISPEFLPYVFDRFRQEDSTTTRRYGGLGLGLSLVRQLIELHAGTVGVDSPGEGSGAVFTVTLPLHIVSAGLSRPSRRDEPLGAVDLAGRLILLVDDEQDTRDVLSEALTKQGARVVAVGSGAEGMAMLAGSSARERPAVIIADIGMPVEDGYAFMQKVRALEPARGGRIPAIALTGYAGPTDREHAFAVGFQLHFAKPVDPSDIAHAVVELLGGDARLDASRTIPD